MQIRMGCRRDRGSRIGRMDFWWTESSARFLQWKCKACWGISGKGTDRSQKPNCLGESCSWGSLPQLSYPGAQGWQLWNHRVSCPSPTAKSFRMAWGRSTWVTKGQEITQMLAWPGGKLERTCVSTLPLSLQALMFALHWKNSKNYWIVDFVNGYSDRFHRMWILSQLRKQ